MARIRKYKTISEAMRANVMKRWSGMTPEQRRVQLKPACAASPANKPGRVAMKKHLEKERPY